MTIQPSLKEVANLLIALHDDYLRDTEGGAVLYQLMKLLHDLSLTEDLCVLDVERIRLKVMNQNGKEKTMSYESFYEWLREASVLIFKKYNERGNRALSLLLTKYVIPFASKAKEGKVAVMAMYTNGRGQLDESSLKALAPYGNFLQLWFASENFDDNLRLSPMHNFALRSVYQFPSVHLPSTFSVDFLFSMLKSSGILPPEMHSSLFTEMALAASAPRDCRGEGVALNCLAFPGFLSILKSVSDKVSLSEVKSLGMGVTVNTKFTVLLQRLSETQLNSTILKFVDNEIKVRAKSSLCDNYSKGSRGFDSCASPTLPPSMTVTSVLWLARQAGLTQMPGLTLNALLDELISHADTTKIQTDGQRAQAWSIKHLPHSLCQIAECYSTEKSLDKALCLSGISSSGRVTLLLAQYIPAVFFASPAGAPIVLLSLYTPQCIRRLSTVSPLIDSFFRGISALPREASHFLSNSDLDLSAVDTPYECRRIESATYRDFNKLCMMSGVIPHLISGTLIHETCEHLLGFHLVDDSIEVQIVRNDWIEILFTLAQICFRDYQTKVIIQYQAAAASVAEDSIEKLSDLLKCFNSAAHLPHALNRVRKGSDLKSFLMKSVRLKSVAKWELPTSPRINITNSSDSLAALSPIRKVKTQIQASRTIRNTNSTGFKSSFSMEDLTSTGFSLKQIMISLLHYPHNSFDLNPWTLYRMLLDSVRYSRDADDCDEPGPDSESHQNDDIRKSMWCRTAKVLQNFCTQYRILPTDLTAYFASFYKLDYYVADTTQMQRLRDAEEKYGMPGSPFYLNEEKSYVKQIKVMKPSLQGLMASPVFELLYTDRATHLLFSNRELLYGEFSRACALLRSSDPFTRDLKTPLPSLQAMNAIPMDCRMTVSSALLWAEETAGISRTEATLQLKRSVLLSGCNDITSGYLLTFSVFLIYAIHCFSSHALLCALPLQSQQLLDVFEGCLQKMIKTSKVRLKATQRSLQLSMSLLTSIYRLPSAKSQDGRICGAERLIVARHSLLLFDNHISTGFSCSESELPPRPPPILWDACRFLEFCCFYGIVEIMGSLLVPLNAFKSHLSDINLLSLGPSENCVLALTPVRANSALIITLFDGVVRDIAVSHAAAVIDFLAGELLPMMMSITDSNITQPNGVMDSDKLIAPIDQSRGLEFEDMIRYGGDEAMTSFSLSQRSLRAAFASLVLTSSLGVSSFAHAPSSNNERDDINQRKSYREGGARGEVLLSVVCTYLSCCGLIQQIDIATIAKQSLHSRIRPILAPCEMLNETSFSESKQSDGLANIVSVSYTEFEEMFLRCAFSCWKSSGAMSGVGDLEPCPAIMLSSCCISMDGFDRMDTKNAVYKYCIEGMLVIKNDEEEDEEDEEEDEVSGAKSKVTPSWGTDFVGPYARTLLALSPLPVEVAEAAAALDRDTLEVQRKEEQIVREMEEEARHLLLEQELKEKMDQEMKILGVERKYVDSYMSLRQPLTSMRSLERIPEIDKMQLLLDKTEYLNNPSLGINLLLDGTKEELWPVYATYCSCGDSTDPGKLSGPNLFTLLSKLSILGNHTALSDVGVLLHQISAHLHAQSSLSLASISSSESIESPTLSFEQFLVFLCAYSQQYFESECPSSVIETSDTPQPSLSDPAAVKREAICLLYKEAKEGIYSPNICILPNSKKIEIIPSVTNTNPCPSPFRASTTMTHNAEEGNIPSTPISTVRRKTGGPKCLDVIIGSDSATASGSASLSRLWFAQWRDYMTSSSTFRRLLEDRMLPTLRGHVMLAFPNDARHRDKYAVLFSLEVLLTLQKVEPILRSVFLAEGSVSGGRSEKSSNLPQRGNNCDNSNNLQMLPILSALKRINLVPQVITEAEIQQLMRDVMPERLTSTSTSNTTSTSTSLRSTSPLSPIEVSTSSMRSSKDRDRDRDGKWDSDTVLQCQGHGELLFCHWEWLVCVVAYEATESAVRLSSTWTDPVTIPCLIADLIVSIASAMECTLPSNKIST